MEYAVIGYLIVIVMMYLLMKSKASPIALFILIPVVGALIAGYSVPEINKFIVKGMSKVTGNAILFCFSVVYFGIMNSVGIFDPLVDFLVKKAGNNVIAVTMATAVVAIIAHLDGATATTVLVTIPALLPVYRRMNIRPEALLAIVTLGMGVMNLLPWGGPTARVAAVTGLEVNYLWIKMIPTQIFGAIATVATAMLIGMYEKKNGAGYKMVADADGVATGVPEIKEGKKFTPILAFNLTLTVLLIGLLSWGKVQAYALFMLALSIALFVNYPGLKAQEDIIKKNSVAAFMIAATMLASGLFVGIINESAMLKNMALAMIEVVPAVLLKYIHLIIGFLGAPIGMAIGTDAFFYGLVPLVIEVAKNFGVDKESVSFASLLGKNLGVMISPLTPATLLAIGLADVELRSHIKYTFGWVMGLTFVMMAFGVVTGLIGL